MSPSGLLMGPSGVHIRPTALQFGPSGLLMGLSGHFIRPIRS